MDTNVGDITSNGNLKVFFIVTFCFSWLLWLPYVLWGFDVIGLSDGVVSLMTVAVMIGAFGPLVGAVVATLLEEGLVGVKRFFRKSLSFRIKPFYYVVAFLLPMIVTAFAHYFVNVVGIDELPSNLFPEDLSIPVFLLVIPYFLFILFLGGGQEEFGWRGYAQVPMQNRFGLIGASLLIGIIWSLWHLPLWFMPGEGHTYYSFFAFAIYAVSTSVILGWLYNASEKKMVVAWIFHAMGNVAVPFFPVLHMEKVPQPGYWVWAIMNLLIALMVVWSMKRREVSSV